MTEQTATTIDPDLTEAAAGPSATTPTASTAPVDAGSTRSADDVTATADDVTATADGAPVGSDTPVGSDAPVDPDSTGTGTGSGTGTDGAEGAAGEESTGPSSSSAELEALVGDWSTLPDIATALDVDVPRVRQYLREGQLAAIRRGERRVLSVPTAFVADQRVVKGLPGTLTVLADNGYSIPEAITWLFTPEDTLPGSPISALRENRGTEVRRRAQALAF